MPGVSAVIVALIGAVGGAAVAGFGAWMRTRRSVQSAARLIHAELTDNSAAIRYFRKVGSWPTIGEVRHAAWDEQGVTLSRMRQATPFHAIQQGYSALEGIAFVARADAHDSSMAPDVLTGIINDSISQVQKALHEAGRVGRIADHELDAQLQAMNAQAVATGSDSGLAAMGGGVIPPSALDAIARSGTAVQQASAKATLEGMEVRRSASSHAQLTGANRIIRDAQHEVENLERAPIVRREGDPATGDPEVDRLYDGLGASFTFFSDVFGREFILRPGAPLEGVVHYGKKYSNMFWTGEQIVAGDGDGELFASFTVALEIIGHEVGMAVLQADTQLSYANQAGALKNAITDVLGVLIKQYTLSQTAEDADWLVGVGMFGPGVNGAALRSLAAPGEAFDDPILGKDRQPAHMRDFVRTVEDNGGVHSNSGIPNHAFYTTAMALGGYAWERAGRIWYDAFRNPPLGPKTGFRKFATLTRSTASDLYGEASEEVAAVDAGWEKVGVKYTT